MDLTTAYLGFKLKNPLIASASPLTLDLDNIRRLEDYGAAAVVLPSIFEEQIEAEAMEIERLTTAPSESFAEALSYFPAAIGNWSEPRHYLDIIRRAREAVAIPVIASLNGISPAGWRDYARMVEQAGASAIELNTYFIPSDLRLSGSQVEDAYLDTLKAVKAAISIPVALKLSPVFQRLGSRHPRARRGRGGWVHAVQSLLPARHRPGPTPPAAGHQLESSGRNSPAFAMDRRSGRQCRCRTCGEHRRRQRR